MARPSGPSRRSAPAAAQPIAAPLAPPLPSRRSISRPTSAPITLPIMLIPLPLFRSYNGALSRRFPERPVTLTAHHRLGPYQPVESRFIDQPQFQSRLAQRQSFGVGDLGDLC